MSKARRRHLERPFEIQHRLKHCQICLLMEHHWEQIHDVLCLSEIENRNRVLETKVSQERGIRFGVWEIEESFVHSYRSEDGIQIGMEVSRTGTQQRGSMMQFRFNTKNNVIKAAFLLHLPTNARIALYLRNHTHNLRAMNLQRLVVIDGRSTAPQTERHAMCDRPLLREREWNL